MTGDQTQAARYLIERDPHVFTYDIPSVSLPPELQPEWVALTFGRWILYDKSDTKLPWAYYGPLGSMWFETPERLVLWVHQQEEII